MTIKILAVAFLALALTACESSTENANNTNENKPAAASPTAATPATTSSPASSPAASPAASVQLKAGDKVKVTLNGSSSDATVVSVDEKAGKATVKILGQKEDKTVAIAAVSKQK
jgi:sRNA-binding protein